MWGVTARSNRLQRLPELGCIASLHSVNLSCNRITELPGTLPSRLACLLLVRCVASGCRHAVG